MKVIMCSRFFPVGHPKAGLPTYFVEKIWAHLADKTDMMMGSFDMDFHVYYNCSLPKSHTIRAGNRFKPGDWASLRVWADKPYRSKTVEFAQVEVKRTWQFILYPVWDDFYVDIGKSIGIPFSSSSKELQIVAKNDGLSIEDFISWFSIHPKREGPLFIGQVICWNDKIEYL